MEGPIHHVEHTHRVPGDYPKGPGKRRDSKKFEVDGAEPEHDEDPEAPASEDLQIGPPLDDEAGGRVDLTA